MGGETSKIEQQNSQLRKSIMDQVTKLPMKDRAFIRACCNAEIAQIKSLIESNVNPNVPGLTHCSPLHFIICSNENPNPAEVVKLLLHYEIYPLSTAKNGASALHTVVVNQENDEIALELIRALIYDAFSSKQLIMVDNEGNTPLHLAAQLGRTSIVVELLRLAKEYDSLSLCIEKSNVQNKTALHMTQSPTVARIILIHCPDLVNRQDDQGRTALHFAVTRKNLEVTLVLLEYGALPDITDRSNFSPLSLVQLPSHKKDVDYLLENNLLLYDARTKKRADEEKSRADFAAHYPAEEEESKDPVGDLKREIEEMKVAHETELTLLRLEYNERISLLCDRIETLTTLTEELKNNINATQPTGNA